MIVYLGCTDNMVSSEMVDKLRLERVPRETPYKVSWISDNHSIVVNEKLHLSSKLVDIETRWFVIFFL